MMWDFSFRHIIMEYPVSNNSMNDMSTPLMNTSSCETNATTEAPSWSVNLDRAQYVLTTIGFQANIGALIILMRPRMKTEFNPIILLLLRHQSIIDSLVCLSGALLFVAPPMWNVGDDTLDLLVCHIWHSQMIYWMLVFVSTYSLIFIAVERYYAVCRPFRHQVSPQHICCTYSIIGISQQGASFGVMSKLIPR